MTWAPRSNRVFSGTQWKHRFGRSLQCAPFVFIAIMIATGGWSQIPSQFRNLPTDSNDYVCGGRAYPACTTWAMPPKPAVGAGYTDPTWGTTAYRLSVPSANTAGNVIPAYSRVQAWNSDGTLMTAVDMGTNGLDLYDATTVPPTPINRITTTDGSTTYPDAINSDALWAYTDPHRIYYVASSQSGHGTELRYVDVSACTPSNCALTPVIVHTFSCTTDATSKLGAGVPGNKIETGSGGQGGMFDNTDTYFSFTCDHINGTGRHEIDFVRYNRQTDTVTYQQKWYKLCPGQTPQGCAAWWANNGSDASMIRMNQHPDHHYITVLWQASDSTAYSGKATGTPTHVNLTGNILTVTVPNTFQVGTEAKFLSLSAATYLNGQFVIITSASSTQFTANFTHVNDDQTIVSGSVSGMVCKSDSKWVRSCGVEVFDDNYNFLGPTSPWLSHQDVGFDVNNVPVYVEMNTYRGTNVDYRSVQITDLTTLDPTKITSKRVLWPCSYSYLPGCDTGTSLYDKRQGHISMQGSGGPLKGYALISTFSQAGPKEGLAINYPVPPGTSLGTGVTSAGPATVTPGSMAQIGVGVSSIIGFGTSDAEVVTWTATTSTTATATFAKTHLATEAVDCLSCGDTGFAAMELVALKIDTTAADNSNAAFWRIGRTHGIRDGD